MAAKQTTDNRQQIAANSKQTTGSGKKSVEKSVEKKTTKKVVKKTGVKSVRVEEAEYNGNAKTLIIVESPAKAKTIKKFLGADFEVRPSMGHIVDLPKKNMGLDEKNNWQPQYEVSADKKKIVAELKKLSKTFKNVRLATDEDREGEAIGWHIANVLGLDPATTPRLTFHEITKTAIQESIENPRTLDMNLVDAQQGRRILDRIVGFKISPVVWEKIKRGLSAGRVQSIAVKLVVEREREILAFVPVESWKLLAQLEHNKKSITIELEKHNDKKVEFEKKEQMESVLQELGMSLEEAKTTIKKVPETAQANERSPKTIEVLSWSAKKEFMLIDIQKKEAKKSPPPPFTTSSLQQEASRRLGRGVKQVMSVAQKLYEHGFITYMRTDSVNLSGLAINTSKEFILSEFGENYSKPRQYKGKTANAQEAHEAIRPTFIDRTPAKSGLDAQELKLYAIIWNRTLASQMTEAIVEQTTYTFKPIPAPKQLWKASGEVQLFDGWLKLYQTDSQAADRSTSGQKAEADDDDESKLESKELPALDKLSVLKSSDITALQSFSKPPARYTEASLVKKLESEGIGRPSTYAPTISTIQQREYIAKDGKYLIPTDIAFSVNDFLEQFFDKNIMDYHFTAQLEEQLDKVATGEISWQSMINDFYKTFEKDLDKSKKGKTPVVYVGTNCPKCGNKLIYKFGKTGKFIGCENYPECKYIEATVEEKSKLEKLKEKFEGKPCPAGGTIVVKTGRFGPFLTSSLYPEVKWISSIPDDKMIALQEKFGGTKCPDCGTGTLVIKKTTKKGRRGSNYFLGCSNYPECKHVENIKE